MYYTFLQGGGGGENFVWGGFASPWLWAWWERRSHSKHKGRRFVYKNFRTGPSCFTFALRCYARDSLSFMLLQALHVEIEMKNLNLQVTLGVQKSVGTPFPPHYTPTDRSDANQQSSLAQPTANVVCFILSLPDMWATFYG